MASNSERDSKRHEDRNPSEQEAGHSPGERAKNPAWANGLKQLYDSVVDEPLPDSFNDLLAQFDDKGEEADNSAGEAEAGE